MSLSDHHILVLFLPILSNSRCCCSETQPITYEQLCWFPGGADKKNQDCCWIPSFLQIYTQWPPIFPFSIKIFWQNHQILLQKKKKILKLPRFCEISHSMTPFFGSVMQWTPFLQENFYWLPFDLMCWQALPSLLYMSAPSLGKWIL